MEEKIPFNKPCLMGNEIKYLNQAINNGKLSGNGEFTKKCQLFFEERYSFKKCFLTQSCTDALEMAALLIDIKPGDEVIMPSFTFVSTANAFVIRGAKIVFADCNPDYPNIDVSKIEQLITPATKAIVPVHYGGVGCNMEKVMGLAKQYGLYVIEDAAQAIDSYYKGKVLGGIGHLGCFSFHETKNVISGEGGMLVVNDEKLINRAEILWEKGTNRASFYRGEVQKYEWVDVGSSFLPSELTASFLFAQLEQLDKMQSKRLLLWNRYLNSLIPLKNEGYIGLPELPECTTTNAHLFYILCRNIDERNLLLDYYINNHINAVFHYIPLHSSPMYKKLNPYESLKHCDRFSNCLIRLPLFYDLTEKQQEYIIQKTYSFYQVEYLLN